MVGSSSSVSMKLGSAIDAAGAGAGLGFGGSAGAGVAGAASAAGAAEPAALAAASGAAVGAAAAAVASTGAAGAAGVVWGAAASGAAGTVGAPGTATPFAVPLAAEAGAAAAPSAGLVAAAILLSSDMLRCNSAVRDAWSSDCFCLARRSSASTPFTAPLDSLSLSGAAVGGLRSSTWAWTLPDASRLAEATGAAGAALASWRRNWLKSRDWAATIWRASRGEVAWAVASSGTVSTAPERMRFTLPLMKTLGLVRSM